MEKNEIKEIKKEIKNSFDDIDPYQTFFDKNLFNDDISGRGPPNIHNDYDTLNKKVNLLIKENKINKYLLFKVILPKINKCVLI